MPCTDSRLAPSVVPAALLAVALVLAPSVAWAYVGPGAGVAFLTTVFVLLSTIVIAVLGILVWPARQLWLLFTRKRPARPPKIKRAVLVGLDGLDPDLARRFMDAGRLPNLQRLADRGMFSKLETTFPSMSPVAWSTFATGVQPAKHGIYDFLTRDPRTYLPDLSSAHVGAPDRHLKLGPWNIPVGKPKLKLLRRSVPFWKILGGYRVPCSILRVPITFPAEPFEGGTLLSAMCVPDLKGSQGSFTYFTTRDASDEESIGGERVEVALRDGVVEAALEGPENPLRASAGRLRCPFKLTVDAAAGAAVLEMDGEREELRVGAYSRWLPVTFPLGFLGMKVRGMCRFRLLATEPELRLYASPINIDPSRPVLPVSHPHFFSIFLSKLIGKYATLGLAEDTWALNEGVLDEDAFLDQAWDNHAERESMFFEMLRRTPEGVITCVFDGTDRIQHMFMRFLDDGHPARPSGEKAERYAGVIEDTYARMDEMLGRVMQEVDPDDPQTLLVVLSDHGFKTFRRGVNLNSWLHQHGYLALKEGCEGSREWFRDVDWSRTRAFALGLGGIFLNVQGREAEGVVAPGADAEALASEIAGKLTGLRDEALGAVGVQRVYAAHEIYKGPYRDNAPDLVVGYAAGWRASWNGVRGIVDDVIFDDNTKAWSGDHCIDPALVPGVLFANRAFARPDGETPSIADMAPTLLDQFGVDAPRHMDGKALVAA